MADGGMKFLFGAVQSVALNKNFVPGLRNAIYLAAGMFLLHFL